MQEKDEGIFVKNWYFLGWKKVKGWFSKVGNISSLLISYPKKKKKLFLFPHNGWQVWTSSAGHNRWSWKLPFPLVLVSSLFFFFSFILHLASCPVGTIGIYILSYFYRAWYHRVQSHELPSKSFWHFTLTGYEWQVSGSCQSGMLFSIIDPSMA